MANDSIEVPFLMFTLQMSLASMTLLSLFAPVQHQQFDHLLPEHRPLIISSVKAFNIAPEVHFGPIVSLTSCLLSGITTLFSIIIIIKRLHLNSEGCLRSVLVTQTIGILLNFITAAGSYLFVCNPFAENRTDKGCYRSYPSEGTILYSLIHALLGSITLIVLALPQNQESVTKPKIAVIENGVLRRLVAGGSQIGTKTSIQCDEIPSLWSELNINNFMVRCAKIPVSD